MHSLLRRDSLASILGIVRPSLGPDEEKGSAQEVTASRGLRHLKAYGANTLGALKPALSGFGHDSFPSGDAITSKGKGICTHVEMQPPEGGLSMVSYAKCEDIRSISKDRLSRRMGAVTPATMASI